MNAPQYYVIRASPFLLFFKERLDFLPYIRTTIHNARIPFNSTDFIQQRYTEKIFRVLV
jgi:hypothetical protein